MKKAILTALTSQIISVEAVDPPKAAPAIVPVDYKKDRVYPVTSANINKDGETVKY
jgi:hypothetical protein